MDTLTRMIVVRAIWDAEAGVWVATSDDVPGLVTEADTVEQLGEKLPGMIADLLADGGIDGWPEIPLHIIAERTTRIPNPGMR